MPVIAWNADFYVSAYEYARAGLPDQKIAKALGVYPTTLLGWKKTKPAFKRAIERGREMAGQSSEGVGAFQEYVYKQLPEELKDLWDEVQAVKKERNAIKRLEAIFAKKGTRARQQLFIHALVCYNFNKSKAAAAVGISRKTVESWVTSEPAFGELIQQMMESQGDFFQECLNKACSRGETSAIIFANKTWNKARGFGEQIDVNVAGKIDHQHSVVLMEDLDLDIGTQKTLLAAIRNRKEQQAALEGTVSNVRVLGN